MDQTIPLLCATHNLLPNVFHTLTTIAFSQITKECMYSELVKYFVKALGQPSIQVSSNTQWNIGRNIFLLQLTEILFFEHLTNVDSVALLCRSEELLTYRCVIGIKDYIFQLHLVDHLDPWISLKEVYQFIDMTTWSIDMKCNGFNARLFRFNNVSLFIWKQQDLLPPFFEIKAPHRVDFVCSLHNTRQYEYFKHMVTRIIK